MLSRFDIFFFWCRLFLVLAYAVSLGLDRFRLGQVYRQVRLEGFEAFGYRFRALRLSVF